MVVLLFFGWGALPSGPPVITPPPRAAEPGRWVHLEGAANTRDVGGYATSDGRRVKRHLLYRSGKLARLTPAGAATYRKLGIRTVIDFCNRATPWPLFGGDGWSVHWASTVRGCPMSFRKRDPGARFYLDGVRDNAAAYRAAFALLAEPSNYPVLYHCASGTDRTGVMTALVLSLLGVDRETVIADFRLSEHVHLPGNLPALNALLDDVATQGGIEIYLANLGVTPAVQRRIRDVLLEPP